jgi:hypothetical protein
MVGARHRLSLEIAFWFQKATAKLLNDAFYVILRRQIKKLSWSDPQVGPGRQRLYLPIIGGPIKKDATTVNGRKNNPADESKDRLNKSGYVDKAE